MAQGILGGSFRQGSSNEVKTGDLYYSAAKSGFVLNFGKPIKQLSIYSKPVTSRSYGGCYMLQEDGTITGASGRSGGSYTVPYTVSGTEYIISIPSDMLNNPAINGTIWLYYVAVV